MNADRIDAIRARADAATPGPWFAWNRGVGYEIAIGTEAEAWDADSPDGFPKQLLPAGLDTSIGRREDASFIAHAREDVPALLDEIQRLTDLNQELANGLLAEARLSFKAVGESNEAHARLDAVRELVSIPNRALYRDEILRALNGQSTKDGA